LYHDWVARGEFQLGQVLAQINKRDEAAEAYKRSIEILEKLVGDNPDVVQFQTDLAMIYGQQGLFWARGNKLDEALPCFKQECTVRQQVVERFPEVFAHRTESAAALRKLAEFRLIGPHREDAVASYLSAVTLLEDEAPKASADEAGAWRIELIECRAGLG